MLNPWLRKKDTDTKDELTKTGEPLADTFEEEEFDDEEEDWEDEEDEEDEREAIQQRVYEWGQEWSKTPAFEALPLEQKDESEFIIETFTDYMYTYHGVAPDEWNVADMEACCLDTLPRKISAQEIYYRSLAPVLASFFTFLGQTGRLQNANRMVRRVLSLSRQIVNASNDPRHWGIAKSFAMAAMAEGVDVTNNEEMDAFMGRYNAQMMAQSPLIPGMGLPELPGLPEVEFTPQAITYTRTGPKIGANDPCPCGSGKKYKKCCKR